MPLPWYQFKPLKKHISPGLLRLGSHGSFYDITLIWMQVHFGTEQVWIVNGQAQDKVEWKWLRQNSKGHKLLMSGASSPHIFLAPLEITGEREWQNKMMAYSLIIYGLPGYEVELVRATTTPEVYSVYMLAVTTRHQAHTGTCLNSAPSTRLLHHS